MRLVRWLETHPWTVGYLSVTLAVNVWVEFFGGFG